MTDETCPVCGSGIYQKTSYITNYACGCGIQASGEILYDCRKAHEMAIKRGETIGILENTLRQKEAMWIKQDEEIERLKGVIDMYLEWCPGCCLFDKFIKPKLKKCNLQQTTKEEK